MSNSAARPPSILQSPSRSRSQSQASPVVPSDASSTALTPKGSNTRSCLLRAALSEFADRGFAGASTTAIARAANVKQPLINYHFGDKHALWRSTVEFAFAEWLAVVEVLRSDLAPGVEDAPNVKKILAFLARFAGRQSEASRLLLHELSCASERGEYLFQRIWEPMLEILAVAMASTAKGDAGSDHRGEAHQAALSVLAPLCVRPEASLDLEPEALVRNTLDGVTSH